MLRVAALRGLLGLPLFLAAMPLGLYSVDGSLGRSDVQACLLCGVVYSAFSAPVALLEPFARPRGSRGADLMVFVVLLAGIFLFEAAASFSFAYAQALFLGAGSVGSAFALMRWWLDFLIRERIHLNYPFVFLAVPLALATCARARAFGLARTLGVVCLGSAVLLAPTFFAFNAALLGQRESVLLEVAVLGGVVVGLPLVAWLADAVERGAFGRDEPVSE